MQNQNQQTKKTKVHSRYFRNTNGGKSMPAIRLSGKWLLDAGFLIGNKLSVTCVKNKLIIEIDEQAVNKAA